MELEKLTNKELHRLATRKPPAERRTEEDRKIGVEINRRIHALLSPRK